MTKKLQTHTETTNPPNENLTCMFEDSMITVKEPYQRNKLSNKDLSFMRPKFSHKPYTRLDMTVPPAVDNTIVIPYGDLEVQQLGKTIIKDMSSELDDSIFITTQDLLHIDREVEKVLSKTISPEPPKLVQEEESLENLFRDEFDLQSSQRFLADAHQSDLVLPCNKKLNSTSLHKVTVNPLNCSQYIEIHRKKPVVGVQCIERQQNMHAEYEVQQNKHNNGNSLSHGLSSQYQRELMKSFDDLEETIISHGHLTKSKTTPKTSQQLVDEININWNINPPTPPPRSSVASTSNAPSTSKITEKKKLVLKTAILKPISSNFFSDCGPFFGLPILAWNLIKEYKQISELYGEYIFF